MATNNNTFQNKNKTSLDQKPPASPSAAFPKPRAWALNWDGAALQELSRPDSTRSASNK